MNFVKESLVWPEWVRASCDEFARLTDDEVLELFISSKLPLSVNPNPLFNNLYYAEQVELLSSYPALFDYIDKCNGAISFGTTGIRIPDPNPYFNSSSYLEFSNCVNALLAIVCGTAMTSSNPISHYLSLPDYLLVQTSDDFSDYICRQLPMVHASRHKRPLQNFLEAPVGNIQSCTLPSQTYTYKRFLQGRRLSASYSDCVVLGIPEAIVYSSPDLISCLCSCSPETNFYLYIQARVITQVDHLLEYACYVESLFPNVSVTIGEKIGSFLGTWKDLVWITPDIVNSKSLAFCAVGNQLNGEPGEIASQIIERIQSADFISYVTNSGKLSALVCSQPGLDPLDLVRLIGTSPEFASSCKAFEYLADEIAIEKRLKEGYMASSIMQEALFSCTASYPPLNQKFQPSIVNCMVTGPIGQDQAYNLSLIHQPCLQLPAPRKTRESISSGPAKMDVLAIIHCFYIDIAIEIFELLLPRRDLFYVLATTDSDAKADELHACLDRLGIEHKVVVAPNRGRDVAPMICEGADLVDSFKYLLHLHTKKSPQSRQLNGWREFILNSLVGSSAIIEDCIELLSGNTKIGMLAAPHYSDLVCNSINWGFNQQNANKILDALGIIKHPTSPLDFPSSTMFWARTEAIRPIFQLGLTYLDFDDEKAQTDGTMAHAIERILYYICESQGFSYMNVIGSTPSRTVPPIVICSQLQSSLRIARECFPRPSLSSTTSFLTQYELDNQETYATPVVYSDCDRPRFNILVPSIEPAHVYGGISTALKVGKDIYASLGSRWSLRILVTSSNVSAEGLVYIQQLFKSCSLSIIHAHNERDNGIVDMSCQKYVPLSLKACDVFFATAWWTADKAFSLRKLAIDRFSRAPRVIYLIQDFENGFNAWSEKYALCDSTYKRPDETIAIINSEELANYMLVRYQWSSVYCLRYQANQKVAAAIREAPKKPYIVVYARPSVQRNLFRLILSALEVWQLSRPDQSRKYKVFFAGQDFNRKTISKIENSKLCGKLSLEDYADLISEASLGISLMLSPHPSYPPLEMASAGMRVITNAYECKDLTQRNNNIVNVQRLTIESLSGEISRQIDLIEGAMALPDSCGSLGSGERAIQDIPLFHASAEYSSPLVASEIEGDL